MVSTNWIGDAIMSMPAVQQFKKENPETRITVLSKRSTKALWELHPDIDEIILMEKPGPTAQQLKTKGFDCAYIFPNSVRSAYVPWLGGIPKRIGQRGHWRRLFLSEIIPDSSGHQQFEYRGILKVKGDLAKPQLDVPEHAVQSVDEKLGAFVQNKKKTIALLPGAARGPSKRWPPEHYLELARKLIDENFNVVLSGGPDDAESCEELAGVIGNGILNLAGKTNIAEWAALLKMCDGVVANDSGGMHLATAVGTPVVGIYGITDPRKTGPLGEAVILQKSEIQRREISRDSEQAVHALQRISVIEVFDALVNGCSL